MVELPKMRPQKDRQIDLPIRQSRTWEGPAIQLVVFPIFPGEFSVPSRGYNVVNRALAAHFGLASWFSSVVNSLDTSRWCPVPYRLILRVE